MSTSLRACIQCVALIGGVALLIMIYMIERRTLAADLRNIAIVAVPTLAAIGVLVWDWLRPDRAPDFLRANFGEYFDHEGFCFTIRSVVVESVCYLDLYYQNRFERDCLAILALMPPRGFFLLRGEGITIQVPLTIPGGSLGFVRVPVSPPVKSLGKINTIDVTARVKYPDGRGRRLRFRPGLRVGRIENPNWERLGLALHLLAAPSGHLSRSTPAQVVVQFPLGEYAAAPVNGGLSPEVLWRPGEDPAKVGLSAAL